MRRESGLTLGYFAVYLAYLFLHQESEFLHWLTLVLLPLALLYGLQRRRQPEATLASTLATVGLKGNNLSSGMFWALLLGAGFCAFQLWASRQGQEIRAILFSPKVLYLFPLALLLMLLTAGFTEEFFFRGVLQTRLSLLFRSNLLAIVTAALLFGLYHVPYAYLNPRWPSHGNWEAAFSAAFGQAVPTGLVLGILYVRSRSNLLACILLHSLINAFPAMLLVNRLLS